jgi:hypothetical protein
MARPGAKLERGRWSRGTRSGGTVVVLCGCGRAQALDLRLRRAGIVLTASLVATIALIASGAALLLSGLGALATVAALGVQVAVAGEAEAIRHAGYCPRCTSTRSDDDGGDPAEISPNVQRGRFGGSRPTTRSLCPQRSAHG